MIFLDDRKRDVIREWMKDVKMSAKCRAKMDRWVRYLEATDSEVWHADLIKPLKGHSYIYELRIECMGVEYRPLGCFGPNQTPFTSTNEKQFTLVIGAIEKDDKFIPLQAPETAKGRRILIHNDRSRVHEY